MRRAAMNGTVPAEPGGAPAASSDEIEPRELSQLDTAQQRAEVLADALPWLRRFAGQIVVVKYGGNAMTDETPQAGVRRRHGVPAHRRAAPGGGARRRPADQRDAQTAWPAGRIQGRLPGHHPGDDGRRADGAGRSGRPGAGQPDQRPRPAGRRHVRRGREPVHRRPPRRAGRRRRHRRRPGRRRRRGQPGRRRSTWSTPAASRSCPRSPPTWTGWCTTSTPTPPPPPWRSRWTRRNW